MLDDFQKHLEQAHACTRGMRRAGGSERAESKEEEKDVGRLPRDYQAVQLDHTHRGIFNDFSGTHPCERQEHPNDMCELSK